MGFTRCQWEGSAIALIRLDEALDLGLIDPAMYGRGAAGARAFPGGGGFGANVPFFRLPRFFKSGVYGGPRFGLGPLGLGLGLSPQAPAFMAGAGAVPVGRRLGVPSRPRTREEELAAMESLRQAGALPGAAAPVARRAVAAAAPIAAARLAAIRAQTQQAVQAGAEPQALLRQIKFALNTAKMANPDALAELILADSIGTTEPGRLDETLALQEHARGERAPFGGPSIVPEGLSVDQVRVLEGALGPLNTNELALLTPEDLVQLGQLAEELRAPVGALAAPEVDVPTPTDALPSGRELAGGLGIGAGAATIAAALLGRDVNPTGAALGTIGGLTSIAANLPNVAPDLAQSLRALIPDSAQGVLGAVGPVLGLAGAAQGFAEGDIGKGVLGTAQSVIQGLANPQISQFLTGLTGAATPALTGAALQAGLIGAEEAFIGASTMGLAAAEAAPLLANAGPYAAAAVAAYMFAKGLAREGLGYFKAGLERDILTGFGVNFGPSKKYLQFGGNLTETLQVEHQALQQLINRLQGAKTQGDLTESLETFRGRIGERVGGFGQDVPDIYTLPTLPGAGGSQRERGQVAEFGPAVAQVQEGINQLRANLPAGAASPWTPTPPTNPAAQPLYDAILQGGYTRRMAQTYGEPADLAERGLSDPTWLQTHLGTTSFRTGYNPQPVGNLLSQTAPPAPPPDLSDQPLEQTAN